MKIFVALSCLLFAAEGQSGVVVTRVVAMDYPWFARHNDMQGTVEVTATIKEGLATNMRVAPGPPPALADPAKETLAKWRFTGCSECEVKFVFTFVLRGVCNALPDRCPTEFEVDLPGKITAKSKLQGGLGAL